MRKLTKKDRELKRLRKKVALLEREKRKRNIKRGVKYKIEKYFKPKPRATKFFKTVDDRYYVMYRSRKGKYTTRPRRDTKYIAEVRSKKSKKVVGYLNKIFDGEITARRFSLDREGFVTKEKSVPKNVLLKSKDFTKFTLNTKNTILEETPKKALEAAKKIQAHARKELFCIFSITVRIPSGHINTSEYNIRKGEKLKSILNIMAFAIIEAVKTSMYRASPKLIAYSPNKPHTRKLDCEVTIYESY